MFLAQFCYYSYYSDSLSVFVIADSVVELLERCLYFSRIFLPANKVNIKIPLELRRKFYGNPNITLNINSDCLFSVWNLHQAD